MPQLLKQLNEKDMQAKGLKLSAEDIYSINRSSIKDAVVQFGGGCTGELVSGEGLMFTNHHCAYSYIQSHSSVTNDYLQKGFWAMNRAEELPCHGLTATFIVRIDDVTQKVTKHIDPNQTPAQQQVQIQATIKQLCKEAEMSTHYRALVKPFFYGTEYYLFLTEVFTDIRLVGAPPSAIGKFGGDTDNWMWPRHTGDFALFRIYANKNNLPADYSADNVPYKPKHFLPISLQGIKANDFTMVMGFPGQTQSYLPSYGIKLLTQQSNLAKIDIRAQRLKILGDAIRSSDTLRLRYSSQYASIANGWKKWIGENKGINATGTIDQKEALELKFKQWMTRDSSRLRKYGNVLPNLQKAYIQLGNVLPAIEYQREAVYGNEMLYFMSNYQKLADGIKNKKNIGEEVDELIALAPKFFANYRPHLDKQLFAVCMASYHKNIIPAYHPDQLTWAKKQFKGDFAAYTNHIFSKSSLTTLTGTQKLLLKIKKNNDLNILLQDPLFLLWNGFRQNYEQLCLPVYRETIQSAEANNQLYMKGLMEMLPNKIFYPDANSTLRVAYGKIEPYSPQDGITYTYQTSLEGVMEKEDSTQAEFTVHPKLKSLSQNKDYGLYGVNGTMPVAFIASNHTTGGNSGSPVMNSKGELIGINFDRNWEGTMSDLSYAEDRCRNIAVDIRYALFIIDKFAGAGYLIKEMRIN